MQTLQAPSNKPQINPSYRRRYQTTTSSCECPANVHGKYICKHIRLERFIQETNRMVMQSISLWRTVKHQDSAIKIRLSILRKLLSDSQISAAYSLNPPERTKEYSIRAAWLKTQVNKLEKRVAMIDRAKKASNAPVVTVSKEKQCEHPRTREEGYREKHVYCLDCRQHVKSYYPDSF